MTKLVVTGSVAYDYLMSFPGRFTDHLLPDQLQQISLSFLVDGMQKQKGGNAGNIAYTIGLLGGNPKMMATAGEDFRSYREWLEAHGVDTSSTMVIEGEHCASFFVNTDVEHNQIASFYAGAMAYASRLSFSQHAEDADLAIISPNDPGAMRQYVTECKEIGLNYIYDPSQQTIWLSGDDLMLGLEGAYLLAVNEYELGLIKEKTGLSVQEIKRRVRGLLVTKGKEGSELTFEEETYQFPIVPLLDAVEPTGAGDAFRAGLMRGIQLGLPWQVSGRMGALASAYVLEQMGPQSHRYTIEEFIARFRQNFDDEGALDRLKEAAPTAG